MHDPRTLAVALTTGVLFGFGLATSTMVQPEVVLSFLRWHDFGLLLVLGGAAGLTGLVYQLGPRLLLRPLAGAQFNRYRSTANGQTLGGAAIFGVGWGLCGVCPGPAIAGLGTGNTALVVATAGIFAGAYLHGWVVSRG